MSDTPRTDAEYERLFEIYRNWERKKVTLCCSFENDMRLCRTLERELNAANAIIKQQQLLDEENLRLQDRIKRLEDIISRAAYAFFRDGSDGKAANAMLTILEEVRKP